jgi:DNA mismatch repair protein MSH4
MIDLSTITFLELIQNLQNAKSKDCLFGLLNETLTPMGSRILRSNILQPSTDTSKLEERFRALEELATKEETFFAVREGRRPPLRSATGLSNFEQSSNPLSTRTEYLHRY